MLQGEMTETIHIRTNIGYNYSNFVLFAVPNHDNKGASQVITLKRNQLVKTMFWKNVFLFYLQGKYEHIFLINVFFSGLKDSCVLSFDAIQVSGVYEICTRGFAHRW